MASDLTATSEVVRWCSAAHRDWFSHDTSFDARFRERFLSVHLAAATGERDTWANSAEGALALTVLLYQFSRNAFRGTARMYATDSQARAIARIALDAGLDESPALRVSLSARAWVSCASPVASPCCARILNH